MGTRIIIIHVKYFVRKAGIRLESICSHVCIGMLSTVLHFQQCPQQVHSVQTGSNTLSSIDKYVYD